MLAAIGETLEKEGDNEVMGVVVNARKGFYRIGLWTRTCINAEVLKSIGYLLPKAMLTLLENASKKFLNSQKMKKSNSTLTLIQRELVDLLVQRQR